ncbi:MAG: recombinase family protein [Lachnospiraceae bacterium]
MKSIIEKYSAGLYVRLSKDDGDKKESDSIKNQKELIRNFKKTHPEIIIVEEYSDDGYSGVNFERPDFQRMIEDIKKKKINCIIVKDLSRFGRNYIETGRYLEQILPFLGVRFIAINDNYDSANATQPNDQIILPFKNLINDAYCRDISIKVRSNLNAKRKKGDFVGAFTPYGYMKSKENKNKLVIDSSAATIVQRIFQMKIAGMSNGGIAESLNKESVLTPYEHKKQSQQGKNYKVNFFVGTNATWSVQTIIRILENEIYLGNMVQGKSRRPNYKVREQVPVEKSEWIRVENTHEPIISHTDFQLVQRLLLIDTRVSPDKDKVYLFSGILVCAKCGEVLIRRMVSSKKEKYTYYGCYTRDRKMKCKGVSIRESVLEEVVLTALQKHIELLVEMDSLLQYVDEIPLHQKEVRLIDEQIEVLEQEVIRYKRLKVSLHEDYHKGLVEQDEYIDLKNIYTTNEKKSGQSIAQLTIKKQNILDGKSQRQECVELFRQYRNIKKLDRRTLVMLIHNISISSSKKMEICFAFQDEFEEMCRLTKRIGRVV